MAKKAKKAIKKSKAKPCACDVQPEYAFWMCDGRILKNLCELNEALDQMNDDVFRYHVNTEKNDFAIWIKDVMKNEKLAAELFKTMDRAKTKELIIRHVKKK